MHRRREGEVECCSPLPVDTYFQMLASTQCHVDHRRGTGRDASLLTEVPRREFLLQRHLACVLLVISGLVVYACRSINSKLFFFWEDWPAPRRDGGWQGEGIYLSFLNVSVVVRLVLRNLLILLVRRWVFGRSLRGTA